MAKKAELNNKLVQLNMAKETLEKIEVLKNRIHADTRTSTIKSSIDIADMITQTLSKGGKVIIEEPNGEKFKLKIPGIKDEKT